MTESYPHRRRRALVLATLGLSLLFWVLAALFLMRVTAVFLWLGKRIGTPTELVIMLLGPVLAAIWCRKLPISRGLRGVVAGLAVVSTLAFAVVVAWPMWRNFSGPKTPLNPSTPSPLPERVGLPVFPGAEGFGTRTPAGRGGRVLFVTSLADAGPGSLREAVDQPFPRTILFRVAGTIDLREHLFVRHPFVTLAGQSAPGDGICLRHAGLAIATHDVLVQHLRIRPGNEGPVDADTNDALQLLGRHGEIEDGARRVVIDHCSFSWGEDETVSAWYGAREITLSYCIISEALNRSRHRKRTHSAGLLVGDGSDHVSVHHTLMAHNGFRNPLISGGGTHDLVNNLAYNWENLPAQISDTRGNTFINFVGNWFAHGPTTRSVPSEIVIDQTAGKSGAKLYLSENVGPHRATPEADEWDLVRVDFGDERPDLAVNRSDAPFDVWPVTALPVEEAVVHVLATAGATRPRRDAVDDRIVEEVRARRGRIIDSPGEVGGYPTLRSGPVPTDSDGDGLPDDWERSRGLASDNPADAILDRDADGYTNLEEYLQALSVATE